MAIVFARRGLAANEPNYVELYNNPDQGSPWVTNYATGATTPAPMPAPKKTTTAKKATTAITVRAPASSAPASTSKAQIRRTGPGAELLDKLLPLVVDSSGNRTIYGLPPILVYVAGGVLSSTLIVYLVRLLKGGGGRRRRTVSNPKRHRARPRRRSKR